MKTNINIVAALILIPVVVAAAIKLTLGRVNKTEDAK